jgi:hypothetical protein
VEGSQQTDIVESWIHEPAGHSRIRARTGAVMMRLAKMPRTKLNRIEWVRRRLEWEGIFDEL